MMTFIIMGVILLLAKIFLPAIIVYIGIILAIAIAVLTEVTGFMYRRPVDLLEVIGAIIFIVLMINFWKWV